MITLTYIYHDCFFLTWPGGSMVFDYWKDPTVENQSSPRFLEGVNLEKPFYVVVSHHHKDHYVKEIFGWAERFPNIRYILSKDVAKFAHYLLDPESHYSGRKVAPEKVTVLTPGESYSDETVKIRAFASTDIGNSYLVEVARRRVFHGGDLNAWIWLDESTPEEVKQALEDYRKIIEEVREVSPTIDLCMLDVDSRIGRDYFRGARMLVRSIDVRHFFPMHFALGDEAEREQRRIDALRFDLYANPNGGEYIGLTAPYDTFTAPESMSC